ncbi:MAG TPA: sulfite exporter TauE/SafE family protein [Bacteroidia bacterium]|nr:sulfite exporter TauE/SafE family protein [Bacteroidia bacterium]
MEYVVICLTAFGASLLTFFSGFGLGTILTPVMILFFPPQEAIALTGIVHLLNNIFKLILLGKQTDKHIALKFGLTAIIGSFIGAYVLIYLSHNLFHFNYQLFGKTMEVTFIKLLVAALMIVFALFEIIPQLKSLQFDVKYLSLGGFISGFFGGLSGNQGALRSAFLLRYGLSKEVYIATGVVIACMIDLTRLSIYFSASANNDYWENDSLLFAAIISAFCGAYIGNKLLKKITIGFVQTLASFMIIILALLLAIGFI